MAKKLSKRMKAAVEAVDIEVVYSLNDAVQKLAEFPKAKFDETVEIYANLGVDPKQSNQMVRGTVALPHGSGKDVKVIVFTENADAALAAGAEEAGLAELIKKVEDGWLGFDVAVATPAAMKEVRKIARVLGPRGLMPNPKSGTVTDDIEAAIKEVKAGRVEYKMDKGANLAVVVGKRSFTPENLTENAQVVIKSIMAAKPSEFKGPNYLKSLTLSGTMTPGIRLDVKQIGAN